MYFSVYSNQEIHEIRQTAFRILSEIGVRIEHDGMLARLKQQKGVSVEPSGVVRFSQEFVEACVAQTPKQYTLYGRGGKRTVSFGTGQMNLKTTPGDSKYADLETRTLRDAVLDDIVEAADIVDALEHINIAGCMFEPSELPLDVRYAAALAEVIKRTDKPPRIWAPIIPKLTQRVLDVLIAAAGGPDELRTKPMMSHSLEPISPLRYSTGLDAMIMFAQMGQPIIIGPMVQSLLTGPCTLAGTSALCIAEGLCGLCLVQIVAPGNPVALAAAAHPCDAKTLSIVYGSPEMGLLAAGTTQVIKSFGLPAYSNGGYCDAKTPDMQLGIEKASTMMLSVMAGADSYGHMGSVSILGASPLQAIMDDQLVAYMKRIRQGIRVDEESLAFEAIQRVGIGGQFITDDHTLDNWRDEFWMPNALFDRSQPEKWCSEGSPTMLERAKVLHSEILRTHRPNLADQKTCDAMQRVLDA